MSHRQVSFMHFFLCDDDKSVKLSVRFAEGGRRVEGGGVPPPLDEDDLPSGGRKFRSGGRLRPPADQFHHKMLHFIAQCTLVQSAVLRSAVLRSHVVRCLSVCLSVRPSVTLVDCDHIGWKS